VGTYSKFYW